MQFLSTESAFVQDCENDYIRTSQVIPSEFVTDVRNQRIEGHGQRSGEMLRVASVPTLVAHIWLKQGFDIYRASPREILDRLRKENLDGFIATDKRV